MTYKQIQITYDIDGGRKATADIGIYSVNGKLIVDVFNPTEITTMSVTNAAEYLATAIHELGYKWDLYIEHSHHPIDAEVDEYTEDDIAAVAFEWDGDFGKYREPEWHYMNIQDYLNAVTYGEIDYDLRSEEFKGQLK